MSNDMQPYIFDVDFWKSEIGSSKRSHEPEIAGSAIVGPRDIFRVERTRDSIAERSDLGQSLPTDVFVMSLGEPRRPDVTKIGGVPYRPAGMPWPRCPTGEPMTFVAQFRFTESHDLIGATPGEILLAFAPDSYPAKDPSDQKFFHLEWYPLGIRDLLQPAEIPDSGWELITCYGQRYRTFDYPDAFDAFADRDQGCYVPVFVGTKIGGAKYPMEDSTGLAGELLCSIGSINPDPMMSYSFANTPKALGLTKCMEDRYKLNWADAGLVSFVRLPDGTVDWEVPFY
ncbi:MAG: DUF1963 domain-containing protein [Pirellulales bacterium]|nr:DUF1963 domain-containing protein [Pirellulales bacterium]